MSYHKRFFCEEYETQATDELTLSPDFLHCLQDYVLLGIGVRVLPAFIYCETKLWWTCKTHPFHTLVQLLDIEHPITVMIYSTTIITRNLGTRITIQGSSSSYWFR